MKPCLDWLVFGARVVLAAVLVAFLASPVPHAFADLENTGILDSETAATNPKPRTGTVTATVSDITPPSVPILISPENESHLAVNIFPFIWRESTDDRGIGKYELYLDGTLLFDDIGPGDNSTSEYTHDNEDGISTLTPNSSIADGLHTWKVIAYDIYDNSASSATWSFTIDTTAPTILITTVGELTTSISSSDTSTIPTVALELTANQPVITGNTEANATVTVTFTLPGQTQTTQTTTASSDGSFSFTLPTLPLDVVVYLDFMSIDAVGNTSLITDLPIILKTTYIELPPPFDEIIPPIPVPEPDVIKEEIIKDIEKVLPPGTLRELGRATDNVTPIANSLIGVIIPLARLVVALHLMGVGVAVLSVRLLRKALRALYILPPQERMGLVYDIETDRGVPYALVKIYPVKQRDNVNIEMPDEVQEFVSDADGLYGPVSLDPGQYTVEVSHKDYTYVARDAESRNSDNETLYKGEIFIADDLHTHVYFMIPLRRSIHAQVSHAGSLSLVEMIRLLAGKTSLGVARLPSGVLLTATILMAIIAFFYFTIWNVVMLALYLYAYIKRVVRHSRLPTIVGGVLDQFGDPLSFALVQIKPDMDDPSRPLTGIAVQTDELGKFSFRLKRGHYRMQATWFDGTTTDWIKIEVQQRPTAIALSINAGNEISTAQQPALGSQRLSPQPSTA